MGRTAGVPVYHTVFAVISYGSYFMFSVYLGSTHRKYKQGGHMSSVPARYAVGRLVILFTLVVHSEEISGGHMSSVPAW
jgi:hypothetical protein